MKIKLIAPHAQSSSSFSSAETFKIQRVNLPLIAALTPPGHDVTIVDEAFVPDNCSGDAEMVGITVMTDLAIRAYELADNYRGQGVKVVLGGIHPSVVPEEALKHADAIVIGEAEGIWPDVVSDATAGRLKRIYSNEKPADLRARPRLRHDLYPSTQLKSYTPLAYGIETSRGCPYDCEFCSIGDAAGRVYRCRPVDEVIAEIEAIEWPRLFIVDDSLGLNRMAAKKLFRGMIPLRRVWVGQGTVGLAEDLELLGLMQQAGCRALLIGFESVQPLTQESMRKIRTLKISLAEAVRRFHDHGIAILGAFVFGTDHENKNVFDQTLEFAMKTKLDGAQLRIVAPFPGTRLHARLLKAGRLPVPDWWLHERSPRAVLYRPLGMTEEELIDGVTYVQREFYSLDAIFKRFFGIKPWKRTRVGIGLYTGFNLAFRKRYLSENDGLDASGPLSASTGDQPHLDGENGAGAEA